MIKIKLKIILFTSLLTSTSLMADYPIKIFNKVNSIPGKRIKDKSITYKNIKIEDEEEGDVLLFNLNTRSWIAYPVSGLNFISGWDVENNTPEILGGGFYINEKEERISVVSGDYFVVNSPGSIIFDGNNNISFDIGDWLIFNGEFWEKISNNGTISRVYNRKGDVVALKDDYSWRQVVSEPARLRPGLAITKSSIFNIANVQNVFSPSLIPEGSVLKWDHADKKWKIKRDEKGISGKIESHHIVNDEILNEDVADDADIAQAKIDGLINIIDLKVNDVDGELFGKLETNMGLIFKSDNSGKSAIINTTSMEELHQLVLDLSDALDLKEKSLGFTSPDFYFDETKTFVELLTSDIEEALGGEKFLKDERVYDSVLTELDTNIPLPVTGDVKKNETVIGIVKRFQTEINDKLASSNFDPSKMPDEIVELKHFSNSTTGTENPNSPNGDYTSGFLNYDSGWQISAPSGGLSFKGSWDPTSGSYPSSPTKGEIYIVNGDGEFSGTPYFTGDWLVCVAPPPSERWLKVNNTGSIESFTGAGSGVERFGSIIPEDNDYTWEMIDKTGSKLEDLSDVEASGSGDTLAWSDAQQKWILVEDDDGLGGGTIGAALIPDGSISETNIDPSANIQQTKIENLATTLAGLLSINGGTLGDDLGVGGNDISGLESINSTTITDIYNKFDLIKSTLDAKEDVLPSGADTEFFNETKNFSDLNTDFFNEVATEPDFRYFQENRVFETPLKGYLLPSNPTSTPLMVDDSILKAFIKIESQIEKGTMQASSLNGADLDDESITLEKLATSSEGLLPPKNGDTYKVIEDSNGKLKWGWSSITGLNYKGKWTPGPGVSGPATGADNGDFYIADTAATDANSVSWQVGDWAIYNGTSWDKISNATGVQRFNDRSGDVMPEANDYKFVDLDFTGSSINMIENVDTTTIAPKDKEVLKFNGTKWVPAPDYGGLNGLATTDDVIDETVTSAAFATGQITESFFTSELQTKRQEYYRNIGQINSSLNMSNNDLINCSTINDIDVFSLSTNCNNYAAQNFIEKWPNPSGSDVHKKFLNNKGQFSRVYISQIDFSSLGDFTNAGLLQLPLPSSYPPTLEDDLKIYPTDTIGSGIAKIEKKILKNRSSINGVIKASSPTIDISKDDNKVFLVTSGNVTVPTGAPIGFRLDIRSRSNSVVQINFGPGVYIDSTQSTVSLASRYKFIKLVKGRAGKWHIINKR